MDIIEVEGYSDGGQCLSVRLCVCLSVSSSVYFPNCLSTLFISLPVCLPGIPSTYLSGILVFLLMSEYLSVRLSVCSSL